MLTTVAVVDGRVDALQEADVLVGDEHVDEAAQLAAARRTAARRSRGAALSSAFSASATVAASTCTSAASAERLRSCVGNANGDCHLMLRSSMSNASWNASRFGAIVAVGPLVGATASSVFRPWPVM